ncbi:MAG: hypothetical protein JXX28_18975 [Deltaproteobacteria bacterium]|nr:hypothetical protein [Deltaproteobacteria bacterium]
MLDVYIIDRIRREREQRESDGAFIPLHIEVPLERQVERSPELPTEPERGSAVIDFQLTI